MTDTNWQPIRTAPKNVVVETKVHDADGVRNTQPLKCIRGLWFFPDGSMYVYYDPTHWRPLVTDDAHDAGVVAMNKALDDDASWGSS